MFLGKALAAGVEAHAAVLAGEVMKVFLEAEKNLLLAVHRH